jgi:Prokaryotic Cytochrome C oxidase subunit IV
LKTEILVGVWAYMMLAVTSEVFAFYSLGPGWVLTSVIALLASSQAVSVVLFYMDLKDEPGAIRLFALIPLMFLTALLIAMLATLG